MAHRSDTRHQIEGRNALMGALVVVVLALALVAASGSFGRTHRISQDAEPHWAVRSAPLAEAFD